MAGMPPEAMPSQLVPTQSPSPGAAGQLSVLVWRMSRGLHSTTPNAGHWKPLCVFRSGWTDLIPHESNPSGITAPSRSTITGIRSR